MKHSLSSYSRGTLHGLLWFLLAAGALATACHPDGPTSESEFDVVATAHDDTVDFAAIATYVMPDSVVEIVPPESVATAPTIALDPAGSLAGSVSDPKGRPLAGVEITSTLIPERMNMPRRPRFGLASPRATSDERGRFRLVGMDPRSRHRVTFRRTGHAPLRRDVTVPRDRPGQLDVVLLAGAAAQGLVVDGRGEPVNGAEVSLRRQETPGDGMVFFFGNEQEKVRTPRPPATVPAASPSPTSLPAATRSRRAHPDMPPPRSPASRCRRASRRWTWARWSSRPE